MSQPETAGLVPAVTVRDLRVAYAETIAVDEISFDVPTGSMTAIVGPNGAGKSTLFQAIMGLLNPQRGTVRVLGEPVSQVRRRVAYVPQRGDVDWSFPIDVAGVVLQGTYPGLGIVRRPGAAERSTARRALERVGLGELAGRQVGRLSGGQQQRVFLARALAQDAELILLDEPFAGVDQASEAQIVKILQELRDTGTTILAVHHDLATLKDYFEYAVLIDTQLLAVGPVAEVSAPEVLARAYPEMRLATGET